MTCSLIQEVMVMLVSLLAMINDDSDRDFVSALYQQYEQMLYRVAFNILHNRTDAEDAVQDTFVRIIDNLDKIRNISSNETGFYLVIIVKNISINKINKKNRHPEVDIDELYDIQSDCSVENAMLHKVNSELIRNALSELPDDDYEILFLYLIREYSPTEISELFGIPSNTARQRIFRAKQRLIKLLEKRGVTNDL